MKKLYQISLILIIVIIGMTLIWTCTVEAVSKASINAPNSVTVGQKFTVSLSLPAEAFGATGEVTVTFSDGSKQSKSIKYFKGTGATENAEFTANVVGTANIVVSNIVIGAESNDVLEQGGSTSKQISIVAQTDTSKPQESTNTSSNKPTEPEPTFTVTNETMYAVSSCNIRVSWTTDSAKIGGLKSGEAVTRTGVGSNGWSKITYNGKDAYIKTSLLTKEEPEQSDIEEEDKVDETPIEDGENNVLLTLQEEIGVLPEVGNNIAIVIYIIVSAISIVLSFIYIARKRI